MRILLPAAVSQDRTPRRSLSKISRHALPVFLLTLPLWILISGNVAQPIPFPLTPSAPAEAERSLRTYFQQMQLLSSDGIVHENFGGSVALSANGSTALVGASGDDVGANTNQGSAYVFVRSVTTWSQQSRLVASDGAAYDWFGVSVALSADGDTALVGALLDDVGANTSQGSAYVFVRSGTTWSQQQKLTAYDGAAYDLFGISVALSADGDTALVGAYGDDVGANTSQGSAYVFVRSGTSWLEQQKLTTSDGAADDDFGVSVALSADGDTALVGAYGDDVGANTSQGSATVFVRSGTSWLEQQKLNASDGVAADDFGHSVALSGDGDTALIGAQYHEVGANTSQGSAYVFTLSGIIWAEEGKLTASDGPPWDYFGVSVALSADGDTALVGVQHDNVGANTSQGSATVFVRSGTTWSQQQKLTASDGATWDYFGVSVALSTDGGTALIGAYLDDVGANYDQGSAYVFFFDPSLATTNVLVNGNFETDDNADKQPDGWTGTALTGDKLKCNKPDRIIAYEGVCAYVFKGNVGENASLTQKIDGAGIIAGQTLTLSLQVKGTKLSSAGKMQFKVKFVSGETARGQITVPSGDQPDYTLLTSTAVSLVSAVSKIKVSIRNASTSGKMYLDDLRLTLTGGAAILPIASPDSGLVGH